MLSLSRGASTGSTDNSGENIGATSAVSEMDERQNLGMLTSPLLTQERETSAAPFRMYHSHKKNSESRSSPVPTSTVRPVAMHSQGKVKSRFKGFAGILFIDRTDPRGYATSSTAQKVLRRSRILQRVDQWSKATSY